MSTQLWEQDMRLEGQSNILMKIKHIKSVLFLFDNSERGDMTHQKKVIQYSRGDDII